MAERAAPGREPPPPLRWQMRVAMLLELAFITVLLLGLPHWSNVVALLLALPYSWFSATRAAFQYARDDG